MNPGPYVPIPGGIDQSISMEGVFREIVIIGAGAAGRKFVAPSDGAVQIVLVTDLCGALEVDGAEQ
jgi:hypothetical protein